MWLSSGCFLYTLKIAKIVSGMRFLCDFVVMTADISTIFCFFLLLKEFLQMPYGQQQIIDKSVI